MTGIFLYKSNDSTIPKAIEKAAAKISHRGLFNKHVVKEEDLYLAVFMNKSQRKNGRVNIKEDNGSAHHIALDGRISNIRQLRLELLDGIEKKASPNEVLVKGYKAWGLDLFPKLQGAFSILLIQEGNIIAAKDPIGFNPLYVIDDAEKTVITSELKALRDIDGTPWILQPGSIFIRDGSGTKNAQFFSVEKISKETPILKERGVEYYTKKLFKLLNNAVRDAVELDVNVSALLSGGIDSAIICALATIYLPKLDVYTVAFEGSEDLKFSHLFAKRFKHDIKHHVHEITLEEMLQILPDVINALETFDAALIRSAVPMYYICSKIKNGTDVLLTGEGGDELFGGYSYLANMAPSQLKEELVNMLKIEHATGLQRVDRIPYDFGIEARAPWFDLDIVRFSFEVPLNLKIKPKNGSYVEKWIERETFRNIIPHEIAERKKAKFSKGVGSQFVLRDYFNNTIPDDEFEREREIIPGIFVKSKEELYYWNIFKEKFNPNDEFVKNIPRTAEFVV